MILTDVTKGLSTTATTRFVKAREIISGLFKNSGLLALRITVTESLLWFNDR